MSEAGPDEIFIETHRVGNVQEVRAVAARDGLEVSFVAPASAARLELERLAIDKLAYVRRKRAGQGGDGGGGKSGDGRGGVLA